MIGIIDSNIDSLGIPTPPPLPPVSKVNFKLPSIRCKSVGNIGVEVVKPTLYNNNNNNNNNSSLQYINNSFLKIDDHLEINNFPLDPFLFLDIEFIDSNDSHCIASNDTLFKPTTITTITNTTTTTTSTSTIGLEMSETTTTTSTSTTTVVIDSTFLVEGGECPICLDDFDKLVAFPTCNHRYCISCTESHLREQVWRFKGKKLSCPFPKCTHTLINDERFTAIYLDEVSYNKLELYKVINRKVYGDVNIIFCLSCFHPISKPTGTDMSITCDNAECSLEMCFDCVTTAHPGMTCEENKSYIFENLSEEEKKSLKYLEAEQYKGCPKCGITTYKEDGCEYVICLACGHQFCYFCLEPHDHNLSTHVHGPKFIPPKNDNYFNYEYRPRGFFQRHHNLKQAATGFAVGLGAILIGPPVVIIGAIPYGTYRLVTHVRKVMKQRKLTQKKCNFNKWILEEKKRREAAGLEVSDYITENYNKINVKST